MLKLMENIFNFIIWYFFCVSFYIQTTKLPVSCWTLIKYRLLKKNTVDPDQLASHDQNNLASHDQKPAGQDPHPGSPSASDCL